MNALGILQCINGRKKYLLFFIVMSIYSSQAYSLTHHRKISAQISIRNSSDSPLIVHSCTASNIENGVNRCYLMHRQDSVINDDNLFPLGEVHNKNQPCKGYFRFVYSNTGRHFDLAYEFSAQEADSHLSFHGLVRDAEAPVMIDLARLHNIHGDMQHCTLKKKSRSYLGLKKQTYYQYECVLNLVDR